MSRGNWRPFEEAREFARSLHLLGVVEWSAYSVGDMQHLKGRRPPDVPAIPARIYAGQGYAGMRDWLGAPPVRPVERGYLNFLRARSFARTMGFASVLQWNDWCAGGRPDLPRRPRNVPEDPPSMYPLAWRGWNDWLGAVSNAPVRAYRGFLDAREFARSLGLSSAKEWFAFCRGRRPDLGSRPGDIPANAHVVYCFRGFDSYGDWLGTGSVATVRRPHVTYEEASDYVTSLGIATLTEFEDWVYDRRPDLPPRPVAIPTNPHREYAGRGWTTWGDFLRTGSVWNPLRRFRPYPEARELARRLDLRSRSQWAEWCRGNRPDLPPVPADIPRDPDHSYRQSGWTGWGDFLGTGRCRPGSRVWRPFVEAREFVRSLGLRSVGEYRAYRKGARPDLPAVPNDIPAAVESHYAREGWAGWPDFLGKSRCWHRHLGFVEAREFVRGLGLATRAHYEKWARGGRPDLPAPPPTIPSCPYKVYARDGWRGWADFLGSPVRTGVEEG